MWLYYGRVWGKRLLFKKEIILKDLIIKLEASLLDASNQKKQPMTKEQQKLVVAFSMR